MVYYPDLSSNPLEKTTHVGWLDREQTFSRGVVDPQFMEKLKLLYKQRVRQTRGFHVCPFCKERRFGIPVELDGKSLSLGSAEIEISDDQGRVYRAPDLIYHYITEHQYLPPPEFIQAVCNRS